MLAGTNGGPGRAGSKVGAGDQGGLGRERNKGEAKDQGWVGDHSGPAVNSEQAESSITASIAKTRSTES